MNGVRVEWDEAKNIANQRKHGVGFEEASHVFGDEFCVSIRERIDDGEQRWQSFGFVGGVLLLMVGHTYTEGGDDGNLDVVRVITARRATRRERKFYEDENC